MKSLLLSKHPFLTPFSYLLLLFVHFAPEMILERTACHSPISLSIKSNATSFIFSVCHALLSSGTSISNRQETLLMFLIISVFLLINSLLTSHQSSGILLLRPCLPRYSAFLLLLPHLTYLPTAFVYPDTNAHKYSW